MSLSYATHLDVALGRSPLDEACEEVVHLGFAHLGCSLVRHQAQHVVAVLCVSVCVRV